MMAMKNQIQWEAYIAYSSLSSLSDAAIIKYLSYAIPQWSMKETPIQYKYIILHFHA